MAHYKTMENFDNKKFGAMLKAKNITASEFCDMTGLGNNTYSRLLSGARKPSLPVFNLMKHIFECTEEDLTLDPVVESPVENVDGTEIISAAQAIEIEELKKEVVNLQKLVEQQSRDMLKCARVLMDIQRVVNEEKASIDLLDDAHTASFNKITDVSSNVGKVYGILKAMEK